MKMARKASWLKVLLVVGIVLMGAVSAWAVPDKETAIAGAGDRLVPLQSAVDAGWDWIINGATSHSGDPSAYNMYGVVILGLLDAYEGTADTSYYDAATSMANLMTHSLAGVARTGEFHKNGVNKENAGAYDYQFLMRYAGVPGNSGYSDYAIDLWNWNRANTAVLATPEALNDFLLGWAGSDPGAASWMLAAYGEASRLMGDGDFATGCADLIEADLSENGLGWLIGDYMAEAECLEFLSQLNPLTYASTISRVITDLVDNQQGSGCWNNGYASTLQDTAYAIRALGVYGGTQGDNAARKGASWLAANQLVNGGWLESDAKEYSEQDSEGLRGLYSVTAPVTNDNDGKSYYIIQDAIDEAVAFDTIYVAPGTYYENVNLNKVIGLWTNPGAVIDGGGVGNAVNVNADGVAIDGFEIRNGYNGIEGGDRSFLLIIDNEIHDNLNIPGSTGVGILLWGDNDYNDIIGNVIYDNDRQGIFIGYSDPSKISSGNWLEGNIIHDNGLYTNPNGPDASAYGIQLWLADDNYIIENEIYNHDDWFPYGGTFDFAQGIYLCDAYGNLIMGNDLHDNNYGVGQWLYAGRLSVGGNKVHGNSIAGNTGYGVINYDGDPAFVIDAALNWWGDVNGPAHATNTNPTTGDAVSDNVIYSPWLGIGTDAEPGTVGWQPVSPMLIIVDDVGPLPPAETVLGQVINTVAGYLNRAIGGSNVYPGIDTIEVRHGTYDASEPITQAVNIVSQPGSALHTTLNGDMSINGNGVLIGRLPLQGFRVNGNLTVEAGKNAATSKINWCDVYGSMTNNGTGTFDAQYNYWGTLLASVVDARTTGAIDYEPFLPKNADDSYVDATAIIAAGLANGIDPAIDQLWLMVQLGQDVNTFIGYAGVAGAGAFGGAPAGAEIILGGAAGGGGAVEGAISGTYTPGEPIDGRFTLTDPVTGEPVTDAAVTTSLLGPDGALVSWGCATYDETTGEYVFSIDTSGLSPGTYELIIQTDDGQSKTVSIEVLGV